MEENPFREGLTRRRTPEPCTIVLFGASGDLTQRKLLPALYNLAGEGLLPPKIGIIGFARRPKSDEQFRSEMAQAIQKHARRFEEGEPLWEEFSDSIVYHSASFEDAAGYASLAKKIEELERRLGLPPNRLFYLATAPEHFATIVRNLDAAGLVSDSRSGGAGWSRVVIEKPFGRDLESARALNRELYEALDERQIFRIDHYLGKETVQNLLALRFANGIFEPLWNQKYVEHVQITVAEDIGVEGRGGYYDQAGVLRDMVQNHMLQVLSLVGMEPPAALEADAIRDEKVKVLRAVRRIRPREVDQSVVRGQYAEGSILGHAVPGYRQEEGVPADSRTETFVALLLHVENWRWAGVPFLLRSGKRLPKRASEVCIQFKKPPLHLFGDEAAGSVSPNALVINVQPDEGISLRFGAKVPGPDIELRPVKMDFRYGTSFGMPSPEAYERLLLDAMAGDSTLFTRRDEVEAAWTIVTDILEGWKQSNTEPYPYAAGTWGPEEAEKLVSRVEGSWRRL
ncbi:MAG TPA: glucose-6-phosphate dehydrogenase [Planctomycetota bacterium]|nr:glucose-6-phosphate dehydrogenase [Planctomycetota bacterium]